jgi:hypothetical protein
MNKKILFMLLTVLLILPFIYYPVEEITVCYMKNLTGFACPGCGITRSLCHFVKGDIKSAIQFHLFGPPVYAIFLCIYFILIYEFVTRRTMKVNINALNPFFIICVIAFITYWITRILSGTSV